MAKNICKIAVVTGGNRGIGNAISQVFTQNNFQVISMSISRAVNNIDNVTHIQCDVTKEDAVQQTLADVVKDYGRLDVLVNSAGINKDNLLLKTKEDDIYSQIETNLIGTIFMCKWAVKHMLRANSGSIINIGSVVGQHGNPGQCVYSATKSGLVGFTKSLAKEVGSRGITANIITPGYIKTGMSESVIKKSSHLEQMIPLKRFGEASEVADIALFLAQSSYITGQVFYCDGGLHTVM